MPDHRPILAWLRRDLRLGDHPMPGLRLGELRGLRWGDIDWMRRVVFVRRSYTVDADGPTKSGKVRSVPLSDQAARVLEAVSRGWHLPPDAEITLEANPTSVETVFMS